MVDPRTSLVPQTSAALEPMREVLDLARASTTGEVAARRHAASRERLLDRLGQPMRPAEPARPAGSRLIVYALVAAVAGLAILTTGAAAITLARSRPAVIDTPVGPEIRFGDGAPTGSADAIAPFRHRFRDCWREQPPTYGSATLVIDVDAAGHVASTTLAEREGLPENVSRCFVRSTGDITFQPGRATTFRVSVAFHE